MVDKTNINNMIKGWFVGDFDPVAVRTPDCEVGYKKYKKGDYEAKHHHKIAKELTLITKGKVLMNNIEYGEGEIIIMNPGESTDFKALTDAENVVVKIPSVKNDKYVDDQKNQNSNP